MDYRAYYLQGKERLQNAGILEADLDAGMLLQAACHTDRSTIFSHPERPVTKEEADSYEKMLQKRTERIPLQQILGVQDFMGLEFYVNQHVLIPRQDTENLVEEAMKHVHDGMRILDMCTGSGCILLSLLHYSNHTTGVGVDLSDEALKVATENANRLALPERAHFLKSDLFAALNGEKDARFDVLVSNPPYIKSDVIETLMPEVKDHEPRMALDGSADGLLFYRKICMEAKPYLNGGARILFEIGYDQGSEVSALMEENGYHEVEVIKDYAGCDRIVTGVYFG